MPATVVSRSDVTREAAVELVLVRGVEARGGMAEKVRVLGRRGFFDRLVIMPGGRVFFVELKRPRGGSLSPHQRERIRTYQALGCEVLVLRSIGDVESFLSRLDTS